MISFGCTKRSRTAQGKLYLFEANRSLALNQKALTVLAWHRVVR